MASLAESVRRLIDLTVTNLAPPEVLQRAARELDATAELLAEYRPPEPHPRFVVSNDVARGRIGPDHDMHAAMPYDPVIGHFNPLALPVTISFEPPLAVGNARFTTAYEGGPGWVHGAVIAAAFDIVLTAANQLANSAGPTVWLTIRFKRPTLLGMDTRLEGEVVSNDGRRVRSQGRLIQEGNVCVEAEGEFAVIPLGRLRRQRP